MDDNKIHLLIPEDYVCVYHKLLNFMADSNVTDNVDCNNHCKNGSKNIITCWNLFQSAVAAYVIGKIKEATLFINYIKKQLELLYKGTDNKVYSKSAPSHIDDKGKLIGIVSCGINTKFNVDLTTGALIESFIQDEDDREYSIKDSHLITLN